MEAVIDLSLDCAVLCSFRDYLIRRERSVATIEQYLRTLRRLSGFSPDGCITPEILRRWKRVCAAHFSVSTVNCMIAAVNAWLEFSGAPEQKLKSLRTQRSVFSEHLLTDCDFAALLTAAHRQNAATAMLLETIAATGVRVSEVAFLTVHAAQRRMAVVRLKGKTRQIPLGDNLCRRLLAFAKSQGITQGPLFVDHRGRPLDRRRIWERFKALAVKAGVDPKKVHPHALRHLFARAFYAMTRDISKLADILGHSSIDTTRIYIATTCTEHRALMDRLSAQLLRPKGAKKPPRTGGRT